MKLRPSSDWSVPFCASSTLAYIEKSASFPLVPLLGDDYCICEYGAGEVSAPRLFVYWQTYFPTNLQGQRCYRCGRSEFPRRVSPN